MRTIGWMLALLGSVVGGFTAWAERMPSIRYPLVLPHGHIPGYEITLAASLVGLGSVLVMWTRWYRLGGALALIATLAGLFGADQLWTTAASILFSGAMLALFSATEGHADAS